MSSGQEISVARRFGELLKVARAGTGISQDALAQRMADRGFRWMQTTVTRTESGTRPLLLDEFVGLCDLLALDPAHVLSVARGPEVERQIRLTEVRSRLAEKHREVEDAQGRLATSAQERDELRAELEALEADG